MPAAHVNLATAPRPFERVSLARQFLLVSAVVLVLGVGAAGNWLGHKIETSEVNRAAEGAAVYVESILAAPLMELLETGALSADTRRHLDQIFVAGPLARKVVRVKLWTPDGQVRYSSDASQSGQRFPLHDHQALAFMGQMQASITELDSPDNAAERQQWQRLIEIYVPLRLPGRSEVAAVAEFYESMEGLERDIRSDQQQSWAALSLGALLLFSGLYALVRRASHTIRSQQADLGTRLVELRRLFDENLTMTQRLQEAGAKTTLMTELSLRRIAADLHDGPAQDLGLALLMINDGPAQPSTATTPADLKRLRGNLQHCMATLRNIAGGLVVPGMATLSLGDVVRRSVDDARLKCRCEIAIQVDEHLSDAPEAVKVTTYRVVQEAIANSLRHAPGHAPRVAARRDGAQVVVEISDDGPGFDTHAPAAAGHLGLAFLRERVQLLGGTLDIRSAPGQGTTLTARLPMTADEGPA